MKASIGNEQKSETMVQNFTVAAIAASVTKMTDEEFSLFIRIIDLVKDKPDRKQYVMNYTGKMKNLPAILETI